MYICVIVFLHLGDCYSHRSPSVPWFRRCLLGEQLRAPSYVVASQVYYRKKLNGIDDSYVTGPTPTATDNKGAQDWAYNPEFHKRAKHIKRRHFYVRDMVEAEEIVVPLVRTDDNAADFLTKPMTPEKFFKFRNILMNIKTRGLELSADAKPFVPTVSS